MIKKLRVRVIAITMLAVFLVLFVLIGIANLVNYHLKDENADDLLELLAENGGRFPGQGGMGGQWMPADPGQGAPGQDGMMPPDGDPFDFNGRPGMSEETPYETRFFSVTLSDSGQVMGLDTGQIAAVTTDKASEMAREAAASGKDSAYIGKYKYLRTETDYGDMYIFVDCTRDIESCRAFLRISALVSLIGFCAIFVLVVLLSPLMIRPIVESYEKQKRFITDAGHELKTPLAVIESCTEVVEMTNGESKWTEGIRDQVKRLTGLTGALVSLARMDEAGDALELSDVDLSDIVEESLKSFVLVAEQQGKTLSFDIPRDPDGGALPLPIKGDKAALSQLVSILADNAVKYSSEGGKIEFTLEEAGRHVVLTERNPADGLTAGSQEKFFDRFYRGDSSRSSEKCGYGIGLSMARSIAEACGGTIEAESPDGKELIMRAKFPALK